MVRDVIYEASAAASIGSCVVPVDRSTDAGAPPAEPGYTGPVGSCDQTAQQAIVYLPNTVAGQGMCGQRVRLAAVSPGDLVFWSYRDKEPTRVGIAVEHALVDATDADTGEFAAGRIRVVAADPTTGEFAVLDIPSDSDARAKRVLDGAEN